MEHPTERAGSGPGERVGLAERYFLRWREIRCRHGSHVETVRERSEDGLEWKTVYRFSVVNPPPCAECERERLGNNTRTAAGVVTV
jgi:hypothetical protein